MDILRNLGLLKRTAPARPTADPFYGIGHPMDPIAGFAQRQFLKFGLRTAAMFSGFLSIVFLSKGYRGAIMRYHAQEVAPVAKDTFNYMAHGTKDGVREIGKALSEGFRNETTTKEVVLVLCPSCRAKNNEKDNFCANCGERLH